MRDKRIFEYRKESFEIRSESSDEAAAEQELELANAGADLVAITALIDTLPPGKKKEDEITKKMALEVKIRRLNANAGKAIAVDLVEQEYDADLLARQIAGIDEFITLVNERKAAL